MKKISPVDGMTIRESVRFQPGVYCLPNGIRIDSDHVQIEGTGAMLVGNTTDSAAVTIRNRTAVTIKNLRIAEYKHGIHAEQCHGIQLLQNTIRSTNEIAPNTVFLDIWLPKENPYGGAILLIECTNSEIAENDLQHQMNGILTYYCKSLMVKANQCNYNSGFGIHLYATTHSLFQENHCDYCCRFEPRGETLHRGHMGADATGFLAVMNASENQFIRNTARLSGDGFFLAGLSPDLQPCGCNDNVFEENDASFSPNIAFESTFCERNIFRKNIANRSNYGFWCGYSKDFIIEENEIIFNRQAGIAVENGEGFKVSNNLFQSNGHGVLLWNRHEENFKKTYPERDTSKNWHITNNRFVRNGIAIKIAAHQDHGIRKIEAPENSSPNPHHHTIESNDIYDNRIGIFLADTNDNTIFRNRIYNNVEANIRLDNATKNQLSDNTGMSGAYL